MVQLRDRLFRALAPFPCLPGLAPLLAPAPAAQSRRARLGRPLGAAEGLALQGARDGQ